MATTGAWATQRGEIPRTPCPPMARVTQRLSAQRVADPREEVRARLIASGLQAKVQRGHRIGITASSRGMAGFVPLLAGICDAVRECGGEPFLFPAMGSHGGATAEGQAEVLRRLGVNDETVNAPIRATMSTIDLGESESGAHARLDEIVAQADGVIALGCVKTHPESTERIASGLLKITTVGLGKQEGAKQAHSNGLWASVEAVPKLTLAHTNMLFGVACVENGYREVAQIEVVPGEYQAFLDADMRLLEVAKTHFARLPFENLDLLVIDAMGKNFSGTGMDVNVIGTWRHMGGERKPYYRRIVPLSLTPESLGNAIGIGLCDFTTQRLMDEYDPWITYVNIVTASERGGNNTFEGGMPMAFASDREAIEVALYSAVPERAGKVCRIKSTAHLEEFFVSPALLDEVRANPSLRIEDEPAEMPFDASGNLLG